MLAFMEKVRIDTEIHKLDQLRVVHLNEQHKIRWRLRHLPRETADARQTLDHLRADRSISRALIANRAAGASALKRHRHSSFSSHLDSILVQLDLNRASAQSTPRS